MSRFHRRSSEEEVMDDLLCEGEVVEQTLRELDIINSTLGGNAISVNGLEMLLPKQHGNSVSVADLGCGGGDILRVFSKWADKKNYKLELTGIDANPNIVDYAQKNLSNEQGVTLLTENVLDHSFSTKRFDIIHCSLFLHHFTDKELVTLLSGFRDQVNIGFVINDLHRHWLAYYSIKILTSLFSKSSMVKYDAPLSVLRGFRKIELEKLLSKAGVSDYQLKWKWAFRWQVIFVKKK